MLPILRPDIAPAQVRSQSPIIGSRRLTTARGQPSRLRPAEAAAVGGYPSGQLTNSECQEAGTGSYQGTAFNMNNSSGAIQGFCIDQNNVSHGLLLLPTP